MRSWHQIAGVIGLAVLAAAVASLLSHEATAVVIGVIVGVIASIPSSALIISLARRSLSDDREREAWAENRATYHETASAADEYGHPHVVVITPTSASPWQGNSQVPLLPPGPAKSRFERRFRTARGEDIGEDEGVKRET